MAQDVAPDPIATVRAFNRIVTETVGALNETYLARGRSLGASRLLWEIGERGADVRELRARLGLDSGYLSRLLRGLESEGLVVVAGANRDARVRRVTLTETPPGTPKVPSGLQKNTAVFMLLSLTMNVLLA